MKGSTEISCKLNKPQNRKDYYIVTIYKDISAIRVHTRKKENITSKSDIFLSLHKVTEAPAEGNTVRFMSSHTLNPCEHQ